MGKDSEATVDPEDLFSTWMKSTSEYWGNFFQLWQSSSDAFQTRDAREKKHSNRNRASLDAAMKTFAAMASAMAEPEAMESLFKGVGAMPDLLARAAMTSLGGFTKIQAKLFEQAGRIG